MGEYPIDDEMKKALDVMANAGWVAGYTRGPNESEIEFTDKGREKIAAFGSMMTELGIDTRVEAANKDLLWQVLRVAVENID
jgi:hypothetical protein